MTTYLERATQRHQQAIQALVDFVHECERGGGLTTALARKQRSQALAQLAANLERTAEAKRFFEFPGHDGEIDEEFELLLKERAALGL